MAAFMYDPAKSLLMKAALDLSASIKVLIVMTDTTSDAERTVATLDEFTTLDEYDGSNYAHKPFRPRRLARTTPTIEPSFKRTMRFSNLSGRVRGELKRSLSISTSQTTVTRFRLHTLNLMECR